MSLADPLVIGRETDADLVLGDAQVSRHHARVTPMAAYAQIEDLGSANGTFVNQDEIHVPTRLDPGDEVLLGVTLLQLRTARAIAAQPSAVRAVPPPLAAPERQPDYVTPPAGEAEAGGQEELGRLVDARTRAAARTAPLAMFVLAAFVVIVYLATR